jgi:hypothetical protein
MIFPRKKPLKEDEPMQNPWHLLLHAGPGGIVFALLGWFLFWPSTQPCLTPESGACLGGIEFQGRTSCASSAPTCETVFGMDTWGSAMPFGQAFVGLLIGGALNLFVMYAFKRGIWGE